MKKIIIAFFALGLIAGFAFAVEKPASALQSSILKPPFSSIKVQTPNGGETWVKGGIGIVTWTTVNVSQNVNIILKATSVFSGGEFVDRHEHRPQRRQGGLRHSDQYRI